MQLQQSPANGYYSTIDPGEPGSRETRLSVNDTEGTILSYLVGGKNVLEIGTGLGVSTRYMAKSAKWILTVDIDPWVQEVVWPDLVKLRNVTAVKSLVGIAPQFDVVFIDGNHNYPEVMADIARTKTLLKEDGFYLMHDFLSASVKHSIIDSKLFYTAIDTRAGMAIAWVKKTNKEF